MADKKFVFGVPEVLPLVGFPDGRARIRMRSGTFVIAFVRPTDGGIRKFYIDEKDGNWVPGHEVASNIEVQVS